MKKILVLAIFLLSPALVLATQWNSPELCPGVNDSQDNFPMSILTNGTIYEVRYGDGLYQHPYEGSHSWDNGTKCNTPTNVIAMTINSSGNTAIVKNSYDICWATSTDGLNWTWGEILADWNRNPNYAISISCAWESAEKWLYVTYDDGRVYGDSYPYTSPTQVDLDPAGDHKIFYAGVALEGDYMVVSDYNSGQLDLYELTGSGNSWSGRTEITEVNNGDDEVFPVVGVLDGKNVLLFSRFGDQSYDVWYSIGDNNNLSIQPTSLGNIKAMYH